jgi:phosphatidylserine/phosphatidylglycerophosphate/cardiolipin synthase-like enzyme
MFAEQLQSRLDRDVITVLPSRHALISEYAKRLRGAASAIDILGVSLMTVARAAGLQSALSAACSRGVPVRVLIMSHESPAAGERGAEEYGERHLVAELESAASMWRSLTDELATATVRCYSTRAAMFFFRVDDARFISLYPTGDTGANAPTFSFTRIGDAAEYFQQRFDALWSNSAV